MIVLLSQPLARAEPIFPSLNSSYLAAGIPANKIVLGMATYGRSFKVSSALTSTDNGPGKSYSAAGPAGPATAIPGILSYYEIQNRISSGSLTRQWHQPTLTPYAYNSQTGEWVSYDDAESIGYKTSYLIEKGLGGSMFWAIGLDQFQSGFPLIKKTKSILDNPALRPALPSFLIEKPIPVGPHSWMQKLANNTKISRLTIPGTHDTCTYTLKNGQAATPIARTQTLTLEQQLNAGIRFIDIRCRHISNAFAIHHDVVYLNLNFDDVLKVCKAFLTANPSEYIVMSVKNEHTDPKEKSNTRTYEATFDSYVEGSKDFWYLGDTIPLLKDVRGKIVLFRRFGLDNRSNRTGTKGIDASPWPDNAVFDISIPGATLKIQDEYKVNTVLQSSINHKWDFIQKLFDSAKSDASDNWYINFSSGATTGAYPNAVADRINPRLYDYLGAANFSNRLGSIVMDFPDDKLIRRIISLNK